MGVGATQSTRLTPAGVDAVRIGKDVIEILTSGMYVSPVTVYREYIQNAAEFDRRRAIRGYHLIPRPRPRFS